MDDAKAGGAGSRQALFSVHRWCERQNEKANCQRVQRAWISTCLISLPSSLSLHTGRTKDTAPVKVLYWHKLGELLVSLRGPALHLALSMKSASAENASVQSVARKALLLRTRQLSTRRTEISETPIIHAPYLAITAQLTTVLY
jgi:hypothetical protein